MNTLCLRCWPVAVVGGGSLVVVVVVVVVVLVAVLLLFVSLLFIGLGGGPPLGFCPRSPVPGGICLVVVFLN